jgi:hypothetical protein
MAAKKTKSVAQLLTGAEEAVLEHKRNAKLSKKYARIEKGILTEFKRVFGRSKTRPDDYVLAIATEVIMNGIGDEDFEAGVIALLINLYGAALDGDLAIHSNL